MKPVDLIVNAITNSCPVSGRVFDPFSGSGSIVPFRLTQDNSPENLIPLCKSCHKHVESITHDVESAEDDIDRMGIVIGSMLRDRQQVARYRRLHG